MFHALTPHSGRDNPDRAEAGAYTERLVSVEEGHVQSQPQPVANPAHF